MNSPTDSNDRVWRSREDLVAEFLQGRRVVTRHIIRTTLQGFVLILSGFLVLVAFIFLWNQQIMVGGVICMICFFVAMGWMAYQGTRAIRALVRCPLCQSVLNEMTSVGMGKCYSCGERLFPEEGSTMEKES